MARCPYKFPARSRKAMLAAIESMARPYWDHGTAYAFSWDVKAPFPFPQSAADLNPYHYEGGAFNAAWDSAWEAELEERMGWIIERMRDRADEYSTWPGDDQGSFQFAFAGRQGGHMVLTHAFGIKLGGYTITELLEDRMPSGNPENVKRLYRALVCMTADFSRERVRDAFAYTVAFERLQWEEERQMAAQAAHEAYAAELTASRPDMYLPPE